MKKPSTRFRFSHRGIDALPVPPPDHPSSNVEYSDEGEVGLRIAVYKSGRRSFRHRYTFDGVKCALTIGEYPAVNVELARQMVRNNKALLAQGLDPKEERTRAKQVITFGEFVNDHYLPYARKELRSYKDVHCRTHKRLLPAFGAKPLTRITKRDISELHLKLRDMISAASANRYLAQLSAIFARAVDTGHATENPARGIPKFRESGPRKRVLASQELTCFTAALKEEMVQGSISAKAMYLLLLTGLRKMEVLSLRWEHVDLENRTAYLPRTKSGKPRHAFLNSAAVELLRAMQNERRDGSPYVFPSDSKDGHLHEVRRTFATVMKKAKVENLRLHDLRRSYASLLVNSGVDIFTIRDLLGHADVRTTQQAYAHLGSRTLRDATEVAATQIGHALT